LKGENISINRFPDVHDRLFAAFALRNTAREARTFSNPKAIFTRINNHLSHSGRLPDLARKTMLISPARTGCAILIGLAPVFAFSDPPVVLVLSFSIGMKFYLKNYLPFLAFALLLLPLSLFAQPDYPSARWNPVLCGKYYTTGNGHKLCVIHDMEGYYEASISYLNRCDTDTNGSYNVQASIHYAVNGLQNGTGENDPNDPAAGDITQCVREANYAWHAICLNKYSFGTEHEGFVSNPIWYSEAMYTNSAALQRYLCLKYGIPMDRNHIFGHGEWQNPGWVAWMAVNFPAIDPFCNNHTDPGIYWNWSHFMTLITGTNFGIYWDRNGDAAGAGASPGGTWDAASTNWSGNAYGTNTHGFWGGGIAVFAAGSDATGVYTVTNVGTQTVNGLWVKDGTVTFTGGQLNFGGYGSFYTNNVASGHTATFNLPFGGTGSPDKWGAGTAVYNGASTSTGYFSINQGTIAIGNNLAFGSTRLVIGDPNGANFVTIKSFDATAYTLPIRLSLNASGFSFGAGGDLTFTGTVDLGPNSGSASSVYVSNNITTWSGSVTNTGGFIKVGPGALVLSGSGANTYGSATANGNTTITGGTLKLNKTAGVSAITNGTVIVNPLGTLLLGAANQVGDTVPMTLAGGIFQSAGFNEQLGVLKLTANSRVDLGAGSSVLRFADSSATAWTAATTLTITNWNGAVNGGGTEQVIFGTNGTALTSAQINQIRFVNPGGLPVATYTSRILSNGEVVPFTVPPTITLQPTNRVAVVGDTVSFVVSGTGTPAPGYQWQFGGVNVPGVTTTLLQLTNVSLGQAGSYSAAVTNAAGSNHSSIATLAVYNTAAASITAPASASGDQFSLSVTGVPGYKYAIEASTNLIDWVRLQTNVSPFSFSDTNIADFPWRFYRADFVP
jgi:N-acetylmuramoyl-L-alanine amidase-like protein/Ig-like domain-containing protein